MTAAKSCTRDACDLIRCYSEWQPYPCGWAWWCWEGGGLVVSLKDKRKLLQPPGIEPGSAAWQAAILPLDHGCCRGQTRLCTSWGAMLTSCSLAFCLRTQSCCLY